MIQNNNYTLVNKQNGELAFKMYRFTELNHFDHVQRLNYFSLIWIQEGEGKATADFSSYKFGDNQLFAFSPYQPFLFSPSTDVKGVIIQFHPDFFCILKHHDEVACNGVLFNNIYQTPSVILDQSSISTLSMIINELEKDILRNELAMNESVISYLKIILINCARLKKEQSSEDIITNSDDKFVLRKLQDLIEKHFKEKHSPKDYASELHISPNALAKLSKSHFNKTLTNLISERIVVEAKRELYLSSKSVREIANELGYEDEFYFSRFFKKHADVSPSEFRKTVGFAKAE